jgi:Protein of unknown function (DUF2924)
MERIDEQLAELMKLSPARLRSEWRRLYRGRPLPKGLTSSQFMRAIAWRMQEKAQGGLPPERVRQLDLLAEQLESNGEIELEAPQSFKPGTRLIRHWHGKVHCVTVLDEGFEFEQRHYSSLTKIARHITGAAWSGPRFFGLKNRRGETR